MYNHADIMKLYNQEADRAPYRLRDTVEEIGKGYYCQDLRKTFALGFNGRGVYASVDASHLDWPTLDKFRYTVQLGFRHDRNRLNGFVDAVDAWNQAAADSDKVTLVKYPNGEPWGKVFAEK